MKKNLLLIIVIAMGISMMSNILIMAEEIPDNLIETEKQLIYEEDSAVEETEDEEQKYSDYELGNDATIVLEEKSVEDKILKDGAIEILEEDEIIDFSSLDNDNDFAGGNGTEENPYKIETADQLYAVRNDLSAHYILESDIDLSGKDWEPLGNSQAVGDATLNSFKGVFDGNGYTIKNMTINAEKTDVKEIGLFGYIHNYAVIKNVNLLNSNIIIDSIDSIYAGGIVGRTIFTETDSAEIINCTSYGSIIINSTDTVIVGGIVGTHAEISDCQSNTDIKVKSDSWICAGGIIGTSGEASISLILRNCENRGNIIADSESSIYVGGIIGYASVYSSSSYNFPYVEIDECINTGEIIASSDSYRSYAGGIIGYSKYSLAVNKCENQGTIEAYTKSMSYDAAVYAGGIAGHVDSDSKKYIVEIRESTNNGKIKAESEHQWLTGSYAGGIIAYTNYKTEITECENNEDVSVSSAHYFSHAGGIVGKAVSSITLKNCNNYGNISSSSSGDYSVYTGGICGYIDSTDLSSTVIIEECTNNGTVFSESKSSYSYLYPFYTGGIIGLFESSAGGMIKDCANIGEVTAESVYADINAGGITGVCMNTNALTVKKDIIVQNCRNSGNISGYISGDYIWVDSYVGGITGSAELTDYTTIAIEDCINEADIYMGSNGAIGGTVGNINVNSKGSSTMSTNFFEINNCKSNGNVEANATSTVYLGGAVGYTSSDFSLNIARYTRESSDEYDIFTAANSSYGDVYSGGMIGYSNAILTLEDCKNNSEVNAFSGHYSACSGGLAGYVTTNLDSIKYKSLTISDSANYGKINADSLDLSYAGGAVGYFEDSAKTLTVNGFVNSNSLVSNSNDSESYSGGIIGYSDSGNLLTIERSKNRSDVMADYAGGLIGYLNDKLTVKPYCYYPESIEMIAKKGDSAVITGESNAATLQDVDNITIIHKVQGEEVFRKELKWIDINSTISTAAPIGYTLEEGTADTILINDKFLAGGLVDGCIVTENDGDYTVEVYVTEKLVEVAIEFKRVTGKTIKEETISFPYSTTISEDELLLPKGYEVTSDFESIIIKNLDINWNAESASAKVVIQIQKEGCPVNYPESEPDGCPWGNVTGSMTLSLTDALLVLDIINEKDPEDIVYKWQILKADVNNDGEITVYDVLLIINDLL